VVVPAVVDVVMLDAVLLLTFVDGVLDTVMPVVVVEVLVAFVNVLVELVASGWLEYRPLSTRCKYTAIVRNTEACTTRWSIINEGRGF
jgi:hypothetical protein